MAACGTASQEEPAVARGSEELDRQENISERSNYMCLNLLAISRLIPIVVFDSARIY